MTIKIISPEKIAKFISENVSRATSSEFLAIAEFIYEEDTSLDETKYTIFLNKNNNVYECSFDPCDTEPDSFIDKQTFSDPCVDDILDYVKRHADKEIELYATSSSLGINSAYFGISFSRYKLNENKILEALDKQNIRYSYYTTNSNGTSMIVINKLFEEEVISCLHEFPYSDFEIIQFASSKFVFIKSNISN